MTKQNICQTIINEETGEICGHEKEDHTFQGKLQDCLYCPCKKFSPQKNRRKLENENTN